MQISKGIERVMWNAKHHQSSADVRCFAAKYQERSKPRRAHNNQMYHRPLSQYFPPDSRVCVATAESFAVGMTLLWFAMLLPVKLLSHNGVVLGLLELKQKDGGTRMTCRTVYIDVLGWQSP